jgi:hypothetical protein
MLKEDIGEEQNLVFKQILLVLEVFDSIVLG